MAQSLNYSPGYRHFIVNLELVESSHLLVIIIVVFYEADFNDIKLCTG